MCGRHDVPTVGAEYGDLHAKNIRNVSGRSYPDRSTLLHSGQNHEKCDRINRLQRASSSVRSNMLRVASSLPLRVGPKFPTTASARAVWCGRCFDCRLLRRCFPLQLRRILSWHKGTVHTLLTDGARAPQPWQLRSHPKIRVAAYLNHESSDRITRGTDHTFEIIFTFELFP